VLFPGFLLHHSDVGSWTGRKTTQIRVPTTNRIGSEVFSRWRVFFGPGGRRDAGDGGLHSTDFIQRKRRSQEVSFGPKLRKGESSVIPEGNKGKRYKEKGSRTVGHVTRNP